jgi:hypothetical protein
MLRLSKLSTVLILALIGCQNNGEAPLKEIEMRPLTTTVNSRAMCEAATQVRLGKKNINITDYNEQGQHLNFKVTLEEDSTAEKSVSCRTKGARVLELIVDNLVAPKNILRSYYIPYGQYLSISQLPLSAGSKLSVDGGLIKYFTKFEVLLENTKSCLFIRYRAEDQNTNSTFISINNNDFENTGFPLSGNKINTVSVPLNIKSKSVVVTAKEREFAVIFGFEVNRCQD